MGLYWDNGKENGNYYLGLSFDGLGLGAIVEDLGLALTWALLLATERVWAAKPASVLWDALWALHALHIDRVAVKELRLTY